MKRLITMILLAASPVVLASGYLTPQGNGVDILKIHAHENGGFTL